ncbi:MAG: sigma-70 family RNA polymerase sigma factor [Muribaculaceae bacterium]|nr:sigma-70 family RNA polymerase sigma factor [Muribaculaceae bacterium]
MMSAPQEIETTVLVERCRQGDMDALRLLYSGLYPRLLDTARRYVENDTAYDVVHDSILMALTSLDSLHDDSKIEAWLTRIVRNMALNHIKHEQVIQTVPLEAVQDAIPDEIPDEPLIPLDVLMRMVRHLPNGYEQVFRLRTLAGLSHDEISRRLGISSSTSRSQYTHARRMLQNMLRRYWALVLLGLLAPLTYFLINYQPDRPRTSQPQPSAQHNGKCDTPILQPAPAEEPLFAPIVAERDIPALASTVDSVDSVAVADSSLITPSLSMKHLALDLPWNYMPTAVPSYLPNINVVRPADVKHKRGRVQLHLAYGGAPAATSTTVDNFLSFINFVEGGTQRNVRIYTWKDYAEYLKSNSAYMDTVESKIMNQIIEQHTDTILSDPVDITSGNGEVIYDSTPLSEVKHHERPRTYMLTLSYPLNQRWNLMSGLGVTTMRSTFESADNGNYMARRTQRLYYLTLPLGATYNIWQHKRLSLYATGSLQLDLPLRGRETTRYLYTGQYEHAPGDSLVFPTTHNVIRAPWQWSVGAGVGVQYQLLPHVNAFFEPNFRYYIPTHSPVENYRTDHPWDIALPFGIRFTP